MIGVFELVYEKALGIVCCYSLLMTTSGRLLRGPDKGRVVTHARVVAVAPSAGIMQGLLPIMIWLELGCMLNPSPVM